MTAPMPPVASPGTSYPPSAIPPAPAPVTAQPAAAPAPTPAPAPERQVLNGPGVPQELQGQPVERALQMYNVLKEEYLRNRTTPAPAPAPPPRQEEPAAAPGSFWTNPESAIAKAVETQVEQALQRHMGPVIQHSNYNAAKEARDHVASRFPDFQALEPQVLQKLGSVDRSLLADPRAWEQAFYLALGEARASGAAPAPVPAAPPAAPTHTPAYAAGSFFSEGARAGTPTPGAGAMTPQELTVAQKMGMSPEQYLSWRGR